MTKKLRVVDFFCGAGGFSEGFRQAGFDVIWAVDKWQPAVDTHKENHPECETLCDDVIKISLLPDIAFHSIVPDAEIIIGSPPCTFFSNSNRSGGGDKSKGKELIKAFLRIVARKKFRNNSVLKYWILENVPKVKVHIKNKYTARDLSLPGEFELLVKGQNAQEYNAKYYGVPSNRIRYFCGDFPLPTKVILHDKDLIPLKNILFQLGLPKDKLHEQIADPLYDVVLPGEDVSDHHYTQELAEFEKSAILRLKQDKGYMGRMSVPENQEKPARTIMATMSFTSRECFVLGFGHEKLRAPTIREIASLMSFPIDYRFYGNSLGVKYKLVGNAVPPKMSFAFASAILNAERRTVASKYVPITHQHKIDFKNLNLDEIQIKEERRKRITTRFKYHIPHFKFDTYRVELTNHHSNFEKLDFNWSAEIHYNQGKNKAKIYEPNLNEVPFSKADLVRMNHFVDQLQKEYVSFNDFQTIYCMVFNEVKRNRLMGPYELLNKVKKFIETEFASDRADYLPTLSPPFGYPKPIAIGFYLLSKCLSRMKLITQERFSKMRVLNKREILQSKVAKTG
jgi:DNA (cytosine-5)-methyltransferase 1